MFATRDHEICRIVERSFQVKSTVPMRDCVNVHSMLLKTHLVGFRPLYFFQYIGMHMISWPAATAEERERGVFCRDGNN